MTIKYCVTGFMPAQIAALRDIVGVAATSGHSLLMVGATARLVQLDWPLNLRPTRTTRDVDFAVRIESWDAHQRLMEMAAGLDGKFVGNKQQPHSLKHVATSTFIDIVPFGEIESPPRTLRWPNDGREMNLWGLEEAENTAGMMPVVPGLGIKVVTLPCLVLLKLFAWKDRKPDKADLQDIDVILRECHRLEEFDSRIWEAYGYASSLVHSNSLDFGEHAGSALIGEQLSNIMKPASREQVLPILEALSHPYGEGIEYLLGARTGQDEEDARKLICTRFEILWRLLART